MKPISFTQQNRVYAKDQPGYLPLPVYKAPDGLVISCWGLTLRERFKMLFTGRMWWSQLSFNSPLQPISPNIDNPFKESTGATPCTSVSGKDG